MLNQSLIQITFKENSTDVMLVIGTRDIESSNFAVQSKCLLIPARDLRTIADELNRLAELAEAVGDI